MRPGRQRRLSYHLRAGEKIPTLGETTIPFALPAAADLEMRVFLDKSIIEVFTNDRLAALAPHRYAPADLGVSLFSEGGSVCVKELKGWKLRSIYAGGSTFVPGAGTSQVIRPDR